MVNIILKRKEKKETLFYNVVNITDSYQRHTHAFGTSSLKLVSLRKKCKY